MKKFLSLILLSIFSLGCFAQAETKEKTVKFDFTDGTSLTPSLTIPEDRSVMDVTDSVFTAGPVKLSFKTNKSRVDFKVYDNETMLYMYATNFIVVSCDEAYELVKMNFTTGTIKGGFGIPRENGVGTYKSGVWTNYDADGNELNDIHSFELYNSQADSQIKGIEVTYRSPLDVLAEPTCTPAKDEVVNSLDKFVFTFDQEIASAAEELTIMTSSKEPAAVLKDPVVKGKTVTYTLTEAITKPDTYTVSVPKRAFTAVEGYYNKEFSTSFVVKKPLNVFDPETVPGGEVEIFPDTIDVTFPGNIGNIAKQELDIMSERNGKVGIVKVSKKENTFNTMQLVYEGSDITTKDIYTVTVPAETVFDVNYGSTETESTYNNEFVIEYKVAGADAPSDSILAAAKAFLEKTGVGYPVADAPSRLKLADMVDKVEEGDSAFQAAIDAFVATDSIEFPSASKYYTIANVSVDGTKRFLAYNDGKVTLTTEESEAYSFQPVMEAAEQVSDTEDATEPVKKSMYFKTLDGKYLHTLTAQDGIYSGVSSANVTSEQKDVNLLTLEKMTSENPEETFGYIAISGLIGKKYGAGDDIVAYSNVLSSGTIADGETNAYFINTLSGAFVFAEAEAPKVDVKYEITVYPETEEDHIEALESVVVTFPELENVVLGDKSLFYLDPASEGRENIAATSAEVLGDKKNAVKVLFPAGLMNDDYTFVAEEGAFTFTVYEQNVVAEKMEKTFKVYIPDEFIRDFTNEPHILINNNSWENKAYPPSELSNYSIRVVDNRNRNVETFVSDKDIAILHEGTSVVTTGKFMLDIIVNEYPEKNFYRDGVKMGTVDYHSGTTLTYSWFDEEYNIKHGKVTDYGVGHNDEIRDEIREERQWNLNMKLAEELDPETCRDGIYWIVVSEDTFGDANFGKYLDAPASIAKKQCHTNNKWITTIIIDKTVGISGIENIENGEEVIYDLSGRRMKSTSQPGIYIKNGKKVVVR